MTTKQDKLIQDLVEYASKEMRWCAYVHDFNANVFKQYNIFKHGSFARYAAETFVKYTDDYSNFCEQLRRDVMYCFWSKCEYEIVLTPWVGKPCEEKIDVYDQIYMNWDAFCAYAWQNFGFALIQIQEEDGING